MNAEEALGILRRRIPQNLPARMRWLPGGPSPAIQAILSVSTIVAGLAVVVTGRPSLLPPSTLRLSVAWGLNLTGVPSLLESLARKFARQWVRRQFSSATHDGAQSFSFDIVLPTLPPLLGAQPEWRSMDSTPAGMTIGGPVRSAPEGERGLLKTTITEFHQPTWWGNCRRDGEGPRQFTRNDPRVRVQAGVGLSDAGRLCGAQLMPPNEWLLPHLAAGVDGVSFDLSVGTAQRIHDDVKLYVRTARGARLINLGQPTIRPGSDGSGLDVQRNWFDNCFKLSGPCLKLSTGEQLGPYDFEPGPIDGPDWISILGARQGLVSHLIKLHRLDPGETVTVRGPSYVIEMTANDVGELTAPAIVPLSATMREVRLQRSNGDLTEGTVRVSGIHLTWLADLGSAQAAAAADVEDHALVVKEVDGRLEAVEYHPAQGIIAVDPGKEVSLNPQPLPPEPPEALRLAAAVDLHDVRAAHALPGIDPARLAVVQLDHDQAVVVTTDGDAPHIAGTYRGPVISMHLDGQYALARSGANLHLYNVTPLPETSL